MVHEKYNTMVSSSLCSFRPLSPSSSSSPFWLLVIVTMVSESSSNPPQLALDHVSRHLEACLDRCMRCHQDCLVCFVFIMSVCSLSCFQSSLLIAHALSSFAPKFLHLTIACFSILSKTGRDLWDHEYHRSFLELWLVILKHALMASSQSSLCRNNFFLCPQAWGADVILVNDVVSGLQ